MKPTDYFRLALVSLIKQSGKEQKAIAKDADMAYKYFNEYKNGIKNISEEMREKIARALGSTYIDMLIQGRKLSGHKSEPKSGDIMDFTKEELLKIIGLAAGYQKDIRDLKDEIKELVKEIASLKAQCESTRSGLVEIVKKRAK